LPSLTASIGGSQGSPDIAISQVYGGGNNSGAPLRNDFVELFNRGGTTVSLSGWSVQYTSATGTGLFSANTTALPAVSLGPGQYFLVQESGGTTNGAALPSPDATGSINMSATGGKVLVTNTTAGIACNGGSTVCLAGQLAQIVDLVGYDGANFFEGTATAPLLSNSLANFRKDGGCQDTNDNAADFTAIAPEPRNAATPVQPCPGIFPLGALDHVTITGTTTVTAGLTTKLTATAKDEHNQTVGTATITWSSADDALATVDASGLVTGVAATATPVAIAATAVDGAITKSDTAYVTVVRPEIHWIDVSSSSTSLPPGFQTQLFPTARVAQGGTVIPASFVFEAVDPQIATIATVQNTGLVTAVAAPANGTDRPGLRIIATPVGGGTPDTFVTRSIFVETPHPAPADIYAANDEFGDPTPASASTPNDLLIVRPQYTLSYNESHGTPNWVSYELDARQIVSGQDRCNCFTADPVLPADKQIFTSDYTGSGFDRGHMARSFDRTAGNIDNAATFYLTNIVPQTGDLNQGVWAQFENALGDSARNGGRTVYIITGPWYDPSQPLRFAKDEGKIAIPDRTWKVALIGPDPSGVPFTRGNLSTWNDLAGVTVLAVSMPNIAGVRNDPWQNYLTTVDALEAATGYDFLSLLPVAFQSVVEGGEHPPVANAGGPYSVLRRSSITFSAAGSTVPTGDAVDYTWSFGDGASGTGVASAHTYTQSGSFAVTLTISDVYGANSTSSAVVTVLSTLEGIAKLTEAVTNWARTSGLNGGQFTSLRSKLNVATAQCRRESLACVNVLNAFLEELRHYDGEQVDAIREYAERVIASVNGMN
jgi:DNA/RNA endonuclease G (NUC1)